jgi:Tfp pilus assembly protein PilX
VGREVAGSAVAMTPDQMLAAKQAQADMRYAEPKLTNEQLAQAQRDAGKKVEITKTAEGIAAVDKMKKAESPPPPAAYNVKQNAIAYLADPARTSKMIGKSTGTIDICKSTCDSKPECTHFDRVGNSCTLYKGAEWVGRYPGGQSYCKSQCQT